MEPNMDLDMEPNLELPLPSLEYCLFCQKCCTTQALMLNGEMPGAVRSSKLEQQLEHLFILRQLLDIPSRWCEQALTRNDGERDPDNWFRICVDCIELVRKGWNLYQEVLKLESKLKSVKQRVKNVIQESVQFRDEDRVFEDGLDYEIRTIVLGGKVSEPVRNDHEVKYYCPNTTESKADTPEAISVFPPHFLDYDDEVQLPIRFDITYQECVKGAEPGKKKRRGRPKGSKTRSKSEENHTPTTIIEQYIEPDLDDSQSNRNPESPEWNPDSLESNPDLEVLYPDADEDSLSEDLFESSDEEFKPIPAKLRGVKRIRGRPKGSISRNPRAKSSRPNKCGSRWKECPLCPTRWNTQKDFESHMEAHEKSKTNGGAFNCDICTFAGRDEMDLKHHTFTKHSNPKKLFPMKYPCKKCDFVTEKLVTLRAHVQEEHPDQVDDLTDVIPTCSICSKNFSTLRSLVVHERKMHPELFGVEQEALPCACDQCPRRFTNKLHLQYHINHTHLRVNNHICTTCGKGFKYRLMLERHEGTHRDTRDFVCDVCGVDYNSQSALDSHTKRFHSEASSATTSKTANANEEIYKCKYCDMTSTFQPVIFRHMEVHKAEMGHKCDLCQKCYTSEQGLKRHKSINHSNNTATAHCPYCFKTFMSEPYMKDHIRKYCKVKHLADKRGSSPKIIDTSSVVPNASIEPKCFVNDCLG